MELLCVGLILYMNVEVGGYKLKCMSVWGCIRLKPLYTLVTIIGICSENVSYQQVTAICVTVIYMITH